MPVAASAASPALPLPAAPRVLDQTLAACARRPCTWPGVGASAPLRAGLLVAAAASCTLWARAAGEVAAERPLPGRCTRKGALSLLLPSPSLAGSGDGWPDPSAAWLDFSAPHSIYAVNQVQKNPLYLLSYLAGARKGARDELVFNMGFFLLTCT